jgi:3-oxoadipate enol-lactonase
VSRTRYARSGALRIAYQLRGTVHRRRPWLVLIQGMGLDRRGWGPVLGRLRRHFRLVLVDNRGVGRSDRPAGSFGVADMAGDVVAVLDAAGIGRAHVLGGEPGRHGGPGTRDQACGTGRRSRPRLHHAGLALRVPDARALGTAARGDRPPADRGGAHPPGGGW